MTPDKAIEILKDQLLQAEDLTDLLTEPAHMHRFPEQPDGFYCRVLVRELSVGPEAPLHGRRKVILQTVAEVGGIEQPDRLLASVQEEVAAAITGYKMGDTKVSRFRYPSAPLYADDSYTTVQHFTVTI